MIFCNFLPVQPKAGCVGGGVSVAAAREGVAGAARGAAFGREPRHRASVLMPAGHTIERPPLV